MFRTGFYYLEYGQFSLLSELKEELFQIAHYEDIHWKIMGVFQFSLAQELLGKNSNSIDNALSLIRIYSQLGEEEHYDNMIEYRERLLKKYKQ